MDKFYVNYIKKQGIICDELEPGCHRKEVIKDEIDEINKALKDIPFGKDTYQFKFFEDNKFQVIYAAPPEKIDSIGSHINSTISLCMKGKYTWAVEGLVKLDEFKTE